MISLTLFRNEETITYAAGDVIFRAGEAGKTMYIVTEGEVDIKVGDIVVETVTTGGIFGEMALIDAHSRSADAICRSACKLVVINQRRFEFLVSQTPYFAIQVMSIMAERLRHTNQMINKTVG
jgi:CRP-like cAMP-binding protein